MPEDPLIREEEADAAEARPPAKPVDGPLIRRGTLGVRILSLSIAVVAGLALAIWRCA